MLHADRAEGSVKKEPEKTKKDRLMRKRMDRVSDEKAGRGEIRLDVGLTSLPSAGLVFTARLLFTEELALRGHLVSCQRTHSHTRTVQPSQRRSPWC